MQTLKFYLLTALQQQAASANDNTSSSSASVTSSVSDQSFSPSAVFSAESTSRTLNERVAEIARIFPSLEAQCFQSDPPSSTPYHQVLHQFIHVRKVRDRDGDDLIVEDELLREKEKKEDIEEAKDWLMRALSNMVRIESKACNWHRAHQVLYDLLYLHAHSSLLYYDSSCNANAFVELLPCIKSSKHKSMLVKNLIRLSDIEKERGEEEEGVSFISNANCIQCRVGSISSVRVLWQYVAGDS